MIWSEKVQTRAKSEDNLCVVVTLAGWMFHFVMFFHRKKISYPFILQSESYDIVVHQSGSPEISSRLLCSIYSSLFKEWLQKRKE